MANNDNDRITSSSVSVGNWMWTLLLEKIPVVNLITFLVTALGSKKPSKRNWGYAHALLKMISSILVAVLLIIALVFAYPTISSYFRDTPITKISFSDLLIDIADDYSANSGETANETTNDTVPEDTVPDEDDIFTTPAPNTNAG